MPWSIRSTDAWDHCPIPRLTVAPNALRYARNSRDGEHREGTHMWSSCPAVVNGPIDR